MFPLRDENPTELRPYVTLLIIGINVVVWLALQGGGRGGAFLDSLCSFGSIPGELTGSLPAGTTVRLGDYACPIGGLGWQTVITSMFMHGGWLHLGGNMLFLWVFGNNIEDSMGHVRFVFFYLITGVVAAAAHVLAAPSSPIPTVGASGAISGVMGAYLLLYPRVRVHTLFFFVVFFKVIPLSAWFLLVWWFVLQVAMGVGSVGASGGGIAFWAHIGGFLAGLLMVRLFERKTLVEAKLTGKQLTREEVRDLGWF
jgi:membrane associated rhomboid family serine protease